MLDRCAVALDRTDQPVDLVLSLTVRLQVRRPRAAGFTALARRIEAVGSNNFSADAVSVDFGLTWPSRGSRCRCGGRMVYSRSFQLNSWTPPSTGKSCNKAGPVFGEMPHDGSQHDLKRGNAGGCSPLHWAKTQSPVGSIPLSLSRRRSHWVRTRRATSIAR